MQAPVTRCKKIELFVLLSFITILFQIQICPSLACAATDVSSKNIIITEDTVEPDEADSKELVDSVKPDELYVFTSKSTTSPSIKPPAIDCEACVVALSDGTILLSYNGNEVRPMASLTKIMTALTFLASSKEIPEEYPVDEDISKMDYATMHYAPGQVVSTDELFDALLIASGNDASRVLARMAANSEDDFVDQMNSYAQELGLSNTHFENTHGLDTPNHHSTAFDLLELSRVAMREPRIARVTAKPSMVLTTADGKKLAVTNTNHILGTYPGVRGVKTGYTDDAKDCFIGLATRDGLSVYTVVLGAKTRKGKFALTEALLDWVYNLAPKKDYLYKTKSTYYAPTDVSKTYLKQIKYVGSTEFREVPYLNSQVEIHEIFQPSIVTLQYNEPVGAVLFTQDDRVLGAGQYRQTLKKATRNYVTHSNEIISYQYYF